jgi:hypothetical protein
VANDRLITFKKDFRTDNVCRLLPDIKTLMADLWGIYNSASILIMPMSYWPALNKSSILLCTLSLCIKLVLTKNNVSLSMPAVLQG